MSTELPTGYRDRGPTLDDADTLLELITAYNTPLVGHADYTLDDVRDDLVEPGFDPDRDGWLVFDGAGRPAGYGWAYGTGECRQVQIEVLAVDDTTRAYLFDRVLARAREMAGAAGQSEVTVDHGIYRVDEALRAQVTKLGFEPATTFHRMRVDHDGSVARPPTPPGVTLREGAPDEATRRAAHRVRMASFADHFGFVHQDYDEWHELHEAKSTFDWSQVLVADVDGGPVGVCLRTDQFVEDENCGYIADLGVLPEARGRGIARFLLQHTFAVDAAAGRTGTILHVDTNNTTPALGLYESVGMRAVLVVDAWRRTLAVAG
jgi:mycothiol synthase